MAEEPIGSADPTVGLSRIAEVLGIEDTADMTALVQAVLEEVRKLKAGAGDDKGDAGEGAVEVAASARKALKLSDEADGEAVTLAINSIRDGATGAAELTKELTALKDRVAAKERADFLAPFEAKNVISSTSQARRPDYDMVCRAYDANPKDCALILNQRVAMLPSPGRTAAPAAPAAGGNVDRKTLIANKVRAYDEDPSVNSLTTRAKFVNFALHEAKQALLTEDEEKALTV